VGEAPKTNSESTNTSKKFHHPNAHGIKGMIEASVIQIGKAEFYTPFCQ